MWEGYKYSRIECHCEVRLCFKSSVWNVFRLCEAMLSSVRQAHRWLQFKKLYKKAFRCNIIRWLLKICFSSSDEPSEAKMLFLSSATIMVALRICKNWPSNSGYRDVMIADRPSDTSCSSRDTLADLNLPTDEETVDFARVVRWLYSREESKWGESWRRV